jgi:DNA-binding response OmpR family regulator
MGEAQGCMLHAAAALRRRRQQEAKEFKFGNYILKLESRQLRRIGKKAPLTPKAYGLPALFAPRAGCASTRDEIPRQVWGDDLLVTNRRVDRCVNTLRVKIERDPEAPAYIKPVRDIGCRFEVGACVIRAIHP